MPQTVSLPPWTDLVPPQPVRHSYTGALGFDVKDFVVLEVVVVVVAGVTECA